jgi:double-strand break repair protein MRE11
MASIVLADEPELEGADHPTVIDYLERKVHALIDEAEKEYPPPKGQKPLKPLIRLKVDYSGGFGTCNPQRFGQRFVGRVANPAGILLHLPSIILPLITCN